MRNNSLSQLVAAALLGRMQRATPRQPSHAPEVLSTRRDLRAGMTVTRVQYTHTSRYRQHQSTRECMRRIGGAMWEQFKRDDRIHRGLSPDKTTNGA